MTENAFNFTLKALFALKIFCPNFSGDSLIRMLLSKFVTSQTGKEITAIYILPNISRSKGNQVIKFGPLIEYNIRNIFLEKSYVKCGRKTSPRPFYEKSKSNIPLSNILKCRGLNNTLKLKCWPLAFALYNLDLVSLNHFLHDFRTKLFFMLYSIN